MQTVSTSPRCAASTINYRSMHTIHCASSGSCTAGSSSSSSSRALHHSVLQRPRHLAPLWQRCAFGSGSSGSSGSRSGSGRRLQVVRAAATPVQFPPYTIVLKGAQYDLRLYDVHPVVRTQYTKRDEGYDVLGSYFDGQNADYVRYAESQPVIMTYFPDGSKTMQLYIGAARKGDIAPDTPPQPLDSLASVEAAGGELVAVMRFDGYVTPTTAEAARTKLIKALEADGLKLAEQEAQGKFRVAQYGQLFNLARMNEMMLAVKA